MWLLPMITNEFNEFYTFLFDFGILNEVYNELSKWYISKIKHMEKSLFSDEEEDSQK